VVSALVIFGIIVSASRLPPRKG